MGYEAAIMTHVAGLELIAEAQGMNRLFDLDMERYGHVAAWNRSLFGLEPCQHAREHDDDH